MKKRVAVFTCLFLGSLVLAGTSALYAEEEDIVTSEGESGSVSDDVSSGSSEVFDTQADESGSDPSEFDGDSTSMPGERAPEDMPMDDAPAEDGIGIP